MLEDICSLLSVLDLLSKYFYSEQNVLIQVIVLFITCFFAEQERLQPLHLNNES